MNEIKETSFFDSLKDTVNKNSNTGMQRIEYNLLSQLPNFVNNGYCNLSAMDIVMLFTFAITAWLHQYYLK